MGGFMFPDRNREVKRPEAFLLLVGAVILVITLVIMLFIGDNPKPSRVYYVSDSEKAALISQGEAASVLININTADKESLMKLQGIGAVTAENIIAYREENGDFDSADELLNVQGIGENILDTISPFIVVQ